LTLLHEVHVSRRPWGLGCQRAARRCVRPDAHASRPTEAMLPNDLRRWTQFLL